MAHFLEHLVFKGGEKYDDYSAGQRDGRAHRRAAQRLHVARPRRLPHHRARREGGEAIDLLTDFVGRPRLDAEELDRERGVVIQEIARSNDQPSTVAEHLIDQAAFGDHPLGRPVLGPVEHLRDTFTREGIVAFRERRWAGARGGAFLVGNLEHLPARTARSTSCSAASRRCDAPEPVRAGAAARTRARSSRSATPTSRTCG